MHPKYYLFDIGVVNAINGRTSVSSVRGSTIYGAEVDMVVEASDYLWAIEIKSSPIVKSGVLKGLRSFCVFTCDKPYLAGKIPLIPWRALFRKNYLNLV